MGRKANYLRMTPKAAISLTTRHPRFRVAAANCSAIVGNSPGPDIFPTHVFNLPKVPWANITASS